MLKVRLQRQGRRNLAHYRVVIADAHAPVRGKFIEKVGWYNPHTKQINLNQDRILNWLNSGAKPSNTVAKLLTKVGLEHKLIVVKIKSPRQPKASTDKSVANVAPEPSKSVQGQPEL